MNTLHSFRLRFLQERLSSIAGELTALRFQAGSAHPVWRPRINVFRLQDRLAVCADLAGIARTEIDLRVEPRRVWLSGRRRSPVSDPAPGKVLQILTLEIDDGLWQREIPLPVEIDPAAVQAEQRNGLLWISLPLRSSA